MVISKKNEEKLLKTGKKPSEYRYGILLQFRNTF